MSSLTSAVDWIHRAFKGTRPLVDQKDPRALEKRLKEKKGLERKKGHKKNIPLSSRKVHLEAK
jgi:hypothetical protein